MRKGERLRIKVPPSFWTTGRLATYWLCKPQWKVFTASLPPYLSHPTAQLLSIFSLTCAEDLHFLAVSIVLRPRIDYFDF